MDERILKSDKEKNFPSKHFKKREEFSKLCSSSKIAQGVIKVLEFAHGRRQAVGPLVPNHGTTMGDDSRNLEPRLSHAEQY